MTSKNNSDVMFENYDVIIHLVSFSCFGTIQKLNSRPICIIYTFLLISTLHLTKVENRTRKSLPFGLHYCLEKKACISTKSMIFLQKMVISVNLRWPSVCLFSENAYDSVLLWQFSSF